MRAATLPDYRVADLDAVLGALRREGVTNRIELWQPLPGR